jgi:glutamate synthase (NADPH/NADH) large chain
MLYSGEQRDACGTGFVAHIKGERSRSIVDQGLEVLRRLSHRAATGADPDTGDGAGILMQLPDKFFRGEGARLGFDLPANRRFAIGNVFLPDDPGLRAACEGLLEAAVRDEGQQVIGWRDVPVDLAHCGRTARDVLPVFRQIYIRMRRVPRARRRRATVTT